MESNQPNKGLSPCPFAHDVIQGVGLNVWESSPEVSRVIGGAWNGVVECYDCHATGEPFVVPNKYDSVANKTAAYRAVKSWNARVSPSAEERIRELEADSGIGSRESIMSLRNQKSAYCPTCKTHTEQERGANRGERYCGTCGETFTLKESRLQEHIQELTAEIDRRSIYNEDGNYAKAGRVIRESAAEDMRAACIAKVREMAEGYRKAKETAKYPEQAVWNGVARAAAYEIAAELEKASLNQESACNVAMCEENAVIGDDCCPEHVEMRTSDRAEEDEQDSDSFKEETTPCFSPSRIIEDKTLNDAYSLFSFGPCAHSMIRPDCPSCCQGHAAQMERQLERLRASLALPIRERVDAIVRENVANWFQVWKGVPRDTEGWIDNAAHYLSWGINRDLPMTDALSEEES